VSNFTELGLYSNGKNYLTNRPFNHLTNSAGRYWWGPHWRLWWLREVFKRNAAKFMSSWGIWRRNELWMMNKKRLTDG